MNKGLLLGIGALVAVAIVGGGAYLVLSNRPTSSEPSTAQLQTTTEGNTQSPKSLRDLMTLANNQTCTFTDADSQSQGAVYVGGGKVRGDFSGETGATVQNTHMIYDGTDVYVWFDGAKEGFKGNLDSLTQASSQTGTADTSSKSLDPDKQVDYQCVPWTVEASKFQLPNLEFTDYSEMMMMLQSSMPQATGSAGTGTNLQSAQCSACDSLPSDAAAQCKQALNCN